jgi:hypothetical protein
VTDTATSLTLFRIATVAVRAAVLVREATTSLTPILLLPLTVLTRVVGIFRQLVTSTALLLNLGILLVLLGSGLGVADVDALLQAATAAVLITVGSTVPALPGLWLS